MITLNIASKMIYKWIRLVCTLECVCVCAFYWTSTIHWIRWSKSCSTRRNLEDQWVIWFGRFWNRFYATGFCYTFVFNLNFTSYAFTKLLKSVKMTVVKFYTAFLIFLKLTPMEDFCVVSIVETQPFLISTYLSTRSCSCSLLWLAYYYFICLLQITLFLWNASALEIEVMLFLYCWHQQTSWSLLSFT